MHQDHCGTSSLFPMRAVHWLEISVAKRFPLFRILGGEKTAARVKAVGGFRLSDSSSMPTGAVVGMAAGP